MGSTAVINLGGQWDHRVGESSNGGNRNGQIHVGLVSLWSGARLAPSVLHIPFLLNILLTERNWHMSLPLTLLICYIYSENPFIF